MPDTAADTHADTAGDTAADTDTADTWAPLLHRPADPIGAGVFADERFGEHVAFLHRIHEQGYLVAAGPLPDEPGAGMTVLRLPGAERIAAVRRLASTEDGSVTGGLFTVEIRPWGVLMSA